MSQLEKPNQKIKTVEDLISVIESNSKKFDEKVSGQITPIVLNICGGTGCLSSKSGIIFDELSILIKEKHLEDKVSVNYVGCFGLCAKGPYVRVLPERILYKAVTPEDAKRIIEEHVIAGNIIEDLLFDENGNKVKTEAEINFYSKQIKIALFGTSIIDPTDVNESLGFKGFAGLKRALELQPQEVIDEINISGLRGRGGGGFPTGRKWQFAHDQNSVQKYAVCNGDEGDPGAFMDEAILEGNPFAVIEGMTIAGYAIGASKGFVYVRAEYPVAVSRLKNAIDQCKEIGLLGNNILGYDFSFDLQIRLGAGAFVCGEETSLLNSIEGKRGMPRPRPPFPAVKGLWGMPTIINNVETYANVPYILREGAGEFNKYGTERSKGSKVFALGGKVKNVGLVEVPMGTTLRTLVFDIGGGIVNDKEFKAIQTGGPSGGCLTKEDLDTPIDYDNLIAKGSMMGSGGAIVMDEDNCMVEVAKFYMDFICDESCGKCSPCRIGTKRLLELLTRITDGKGKIDDIDKLESMANTVKNSSLCGLGQTAPNPILSTITKFRNEYVEHIVDKKCRAGVCKKLMAYKIDPDKCKKCGLCAKNCPVGAISGEIGKVPFSIDSDVCIKCGVCFSQCKFKAIFKG